MTDKETSEDSSEQFCMLVKNSPDAYLLIKDKIFIDCNQAAEKMLGLQREQIIGFSPAHFAPKYQPDGRSSASAAEEWLSLSSQNGKASFEWMHHRLDGSELFIDVSLSSAVLNGKQVMLVCLHDITARKRAEEALLIFKESLENSTDAIGMSTADGHHYYQNKAFCELFGDTSDYPPDKTYVDKALGNEVFNTIMSGRTWIGEAKMYSKTGQILDILLRAYANKDSNGNITALVGIHTDITARKRAEEDREKLQLHLSQSQKMESIGRLAGGVAHDFNNMLGVILGHAELAIKSLEPTHSLIPPLNEIIRAASRSADLTHQLLAFARKQPIVPKVLDLNETVEHTLKMLRRLIGENIDLAWLPGKNLGHIKADPSQIDQILANLCVNARDAVGDIGNIVIQTALPKVDEMIGADFSECKPGEYVMLSVSDNGCGMEADVLSCLFEPFFTTKTLGRGTGLGLAIVYGAVKQNNGFISVHSKPGQGTVFKIYLPRYLEEADNAASAVAENQLVRGHETILLVEDEPMVLQMTVKMLQLLGYKIIAAASPAEAIKMAKENAENIDLLITDVVMPGMNGQDLVASISGLCPNLKSLFMSGYAAEIIVKQGILNKNVNFMQKPFSLKNLAIKVREVIDASE